ncbi:uridine phosphorylase [Dyadobacter sp. BE34]|uniref:Uridine phosphorylase n=1 Tax=Dyadobacter fermentans TaxID=94254 RepID=A0ABU1R610_9BACT|nr:MULTISPECIES: nucleoside phosphorylase [Dyadobacter]MDR6808828.1 uridine phosphorylase [Dyadobacter fermentans]MDR7046571.1 uridine phosphorylase [Dyadobacter sp. BE242]MDR7200884.1 uridine phosphorylase [Dyadobacter sp. BE34]MDR7218845.1 uridine phosphorylase [Dyadobacter sp. BE31]MDR7266774.1 uridine phosphorylase [Dyadobacter sp. BE32]
MPEAKTLSNENSAINANKAYKEPSVFLAENLLREARRQKNIPQGQIPAVCVLDPDGDIVSYLVKNGLCSRNPFWACYHSTLYDASFDGLDFGIIGCAVGASYAVLLAEQMFVSGCKLLISITSAGAINAPKNDAKFILIEQALRDEGTSYHYLPAGHPAELSQSLKERLQRYFQSSQLMVETGKSWTTDAPYRETQTAIEYAKTQNVTSVEMEAAALYAFATVKQVNIICYAHLTNTMAQEGEDFEKGIENGSIDSLQIVLATIKAVLLEI